MKEQVLNRVENLVTKGGIGCFEQFLLSPYFQKAASCWGVRKRLYVGEGYIFPTCKYILMHLQQTKCDIMWWKKKWLMMSNFYYQSYQRNSQLCPVITRSFIWRCSICLPCWFQSHLLQICCMWERVNMPVSVRVCSILELGPVVKIIIEIDT